MRVEPINLPKAWRDAIRIQDGPHAGMLANPCLCGYPLKDQDEVIFVEWMDGSFMVCHAGCIPTPDES